jgi:hypothetical protein
VGGGAPFASLTFASVTLSKSKSPDAAPAEKKKKKSLAEIIDTAGKKALRGGLPGMAAMAIQVMSLMWMRTTINYQYRHGGTMMGALKTLYAEGGIPRFYKGVLPALVQVGRRWTDASRHRMSREKRVLLCVWQ